ncbi:unnamed protein product, partial [marine sediment metagenome]
IRDIQFEDNIDWVLWQSNIFNDNLSNALKKFEVEIDSGKIEAEAFPKFKSTVMQRFHFLLGFMHALDKRLGGDFFYPKK